MNVELELVELTLLDMFAEAGTPGLISFWITMFLMIVGLLGIKRRFQVSGCRAFTLLAFLPAVVGFYGAHHLLVAFRTQTGHFQSETLAHFFFSGEVAMPFAVGCFGSCVLMFVTSILWMRSKEEVDED